MERINGLKEYVMSKQYRDALGIPTGMPVHYQMLAQGEYNINYVFTHPVTNKKLVLRLNTGSQMHLDHQVEYEFQSLSAIFKSGRTPWPLYADESPYNLEYGVLVMEYLAGNSLDYHTELTLAGECLADIHSVKIHNDTHLISPDNPLQAILDECNGMAQLYFDSPLGKKAIKAQIKRMLAAGQQKLHNTSKYEGYRCCINTELNSGNFLMNGVGKGNFLIDWEKPLWGDPAQDLGHFLAPTTTFWKTDVILSKAQIEGFIKDYKTAVSSRFSLGDLAERVGLYIPINCLRGITWCAMAWIEYQSTNRAIRNELTYQKIMAYLDKEFLDKIEVQYLQY